MTTLSCQQTLEDPVRRCDRQECSCCYVAECEWGYWVSQCSILPLEEKWSWASFGSCEVPDVQELKESGTHR